MGRRAGTGEPRIVERLDQRVAVVRTEGDPNEVGPKAMPALYGAVYGLKFALKRRGVDFKVGPLRARWPDAHREPKGRWEGLWALPVPAGTSELPPKVPEPPVTLETWPYGTVAEILHLGPYADEPATIRRLHAFVDASGYEIAGPHEEEYLTRPGAAKQKTLIRYRVRPKRR